jgi:hypothetical protein
MFNASGKCDIHIFLSLLILIFSIDKEEGHIVTISYYPTFRLVHDLTHTPALHTLLDKIWHAQYPDLYEEASNEYPIQDITDACQQIVAFFVEHDRDQSHQRLVYVGWGLALAVLPKLTYLTPHDPLPQKVLDAVQQWMHSGGMPQLTENMVRDPIPTGLQSLNESRFVFAELARALHPESAAREVLAILDDCLEGYAIFAGSQGRRDLFNWVLVDVIPAAWNLRLPTMIYTLSGPQQLTEEQDR